MAKGIGTSIDVRGVKNIMARYEMAPDDWYYSIWQNTALKFSSAETTMEPKSLLEQNLNALHSVGSSALYTCKFHSATDDDGYISDKTKVVGSFNFKVSEMDYQYEGATRLPVHTIPPEMSDRLAMIEQKLSSMMEEEEEEESVSGIEQINEIMKNPVVQQLIGIIAGKISGNNNGQTGLAGIPAEQDQKIEQALQILKTLDPLVGDHLLALAVIARDQPAKYQMAIGLL